MKTRALKREASDNSGTVLNILLCAHTILGIDKISLVAKNDIRKPGGAHLHERVETRFPQSVGT